MKFRYKLLIFFALAFSLFSEEVVIQVETEKSIINIENESLVATGGITLKYGDITIRADNLKKLENQNLIVAYGNVLFTQGENQILANEVIFDLDSKNARIIDSKSVTPEGIVFGGEETISEGSKKFTIKNSWFTTSPYNDPTYKINAKKLVIFPNQKLEAYGVSLNVKGKDLISLPYYVTSLKPETQRATLFPYIGGDSDRGLFVIQGFDYDKGKLFQGFVDFEVSTKEILALKFSNDYQLSPNNKGNIFVRRFVLPISGNEDQWNVQWTHDFVSIPKTPNPEDRKFYELGYGIWKLDYKNLTTNQMYTINGDSLDDNYVSFKEKYKYIGTYDFKIDQEIGKGGEFNLDYKWTQNMDALKELTRINDNIAEDDDIDPRLTDVDLFKQVTFKKEDNGLGLYLHKEEFKDLNPGYIGDINSYRKIDNYSLNLKTPKIKIGYLKQDKDEYAPIFGLRQRAYGDPNTIDTYTDRILKITDYDYSEVYDLVLGNYYPFKENDFFGYERQDLATNLTGNMYIGGSFNKTDIRKKTYEYDYTTDNPNYRNYIVQPGVDDYSRIYKLYDDGDQIRRVRDILYESYQGGTLRLGSDRIELPIPNSYLNFGYEYENRIYGVTYVPEFDEDRRKIEDPNSKTGYKIQKDAMGNELTQKPLVDINKFNFGLFTTIYDNTRLSNNKYDVKVTNNLPIFIQQTNAHNAMYGDNDIINTPTNIFRFNDDFNLYVGNINLNYNFTKQQDTHWRDDWTKQSFTRNFIKASIGDQRFLSFDFSGGSYYPYEDFKYEEIFNREIKYGFKTTKNDNVLFRYFENKYQNYSNDTWAGWDPESVKELNDVKTFGINFNEWGFEYSNLRDIIHDVYNNSMDLKYDSSRHRIGFVYDTSRMKEKPFDSNHLVRIAYEFGKDHYRNPNGTATNYNDDFYTNQRAGNKLILVYRYENDASPVLKTKSPDLENSGLTSNDVFSKYDSNDLFLTRDEETVYNALAEQDKEKQGKFNLNNLDRILQQQRKNRRYFEFGIELENDSQYFHDNQSIDNVFKAVTDLAFKAEIGYLEKFYFRYRYDMERPDVLQRDDIGRNSPYNFRQHEFETKYMFSKDPDSPWWIGYKMHYTQDGAPKYDEPEEYESSSAASRVDKVTLNLVTLSHRFENLEWEIGVGRQWDKPEDKGLGYYNIVTLKFGVTTFPDKNLQYEYSGGSSTFGAGL